MPARSRITRLPTEVRDQVHRLIRAGHTIDDIVGHLETLGEEVSRSSVGRYKQKYESAFQRYREAQEVAAVWVAKLGEDPEGDVGRLVAEMIKTVAFQTLAELGDRGDKEAKATPEDIMLLARSIRDLETAGKLSADRELRVRKETAKAAAEVATQVGKARGLPAEVVQEFRREILGVTK